MAAEANWSQSLEIGKLIKSGINATIYMVNGFQMKCKILAQDNYTIKIEDDYTVSVIYKSAISTIRYHKKDDV